MKADSKSETNQLSSLSVLGLALVEYAPVPMAAVESADHLVRYANAAFCRLFDKPQEQIIGRGIADILPGEDPCLQLLDRVFLTGNPESYTEQEPCTPGHIFWSYTLWPVAPEDGFRGAMIQVNETTRAHEQVVAMNEALMLGVVRQHELTEAADNLNIQLRAEIAERVRVEEALQVTQAELIARTKELGEANKQLEAFVYSIAHDLRSPLRSLKGFAQILMADCAAKMEPHEFDYLRRMLFNANKLDTLIQDLLTYSRTAREALVVTRVDLDRLVRFTIAEDSSFQKPASEVFIEGVLPAVIGHEAWLTQCVLNLLGNGVKFVPPETLPCVRIHAEPRGAEVRIWFEDNGIGIESEDQRRIFNLFERIHGSDKYPGTGLGLSIVKNAVERMGGSLGVESQPGVGSRFWIQLQSAEEL